MSIPAFDFLDLLRAQAALDAQHEACCPYCIEDRANADYTRALVQGERRRREQALRQSAVASVASAA